MTIIPNEHPLAAVHGWLLGGVGPRPIALASTLNEDGSRNLSPFSFFNVFSANPPVVIFSPARRGRDNTTKHTYHNAKRQGQVVINAVSHAMVHQVSLASSEFAEGVDEFLKSGLTPLASLKVAPARVAESPVQLECEVERVIELGDGPGAGNLIVCHVVMIHLADQVLDVNGRIDQNKIDLVGRLGGEWYCRANGDALFEVAKPSVPVGIGVDALPKEVRESTILNGAELAMLANVSAVPNETDVNEFKLTELSELFLSTANQVDLRRELHVKAAHFLSQNRVTDAWKTILAFNDK